MRWMAVRTLVGIAVIAGAGVSGAQDAPHPLPGVRVLAVNRAGLRAEMLAAAEDDATDVYRAAGVRTTWVNAGPRDSSNDYAIDFTVMIVSGQEARAMAAHTNQDALGFAVPDSTDDSSLNGMAFVLFDRVEDNATKHHVSISRVLGAVIAHEVGHLLLPSNSHSDRGIMRAAWNVRSSLLEYFTSAQAETIRQRLTPAHGLEASGSAAHVRSTNATILAGAATIDPAVPGTARIRTSDPTVASLLTEGIERSATLRELAHALEAMPWFVFVERGLCARHRLNGCLPLVVGRYWGDRSLQIYLDNWGRPTREREICTIAHELQHALEVERAGDVVDSVTLERFFERAGTRTPMNGGTITYETVAADRVGSQVYAELRLRRSPVRH